MARSRWARWWRPLALVCGLFSLASAAYSIWRVVTAGTSLETMFPAVSWTVLTACMVVLLFRGPKDTSWDADNPHLTER